MNILRIILVAAVAVLLALLISCSTLDGAGGNVYPGRRAHPDGSPVPALSYTNQPEVHR